MEEQRLEEPLPKLNIKDIFIQSGVLSIFILALIYIFPIMPTSYPEKGLQVYEIEIPNSTRGSTTISYVSIDYEKQNSELPIEKIETENSGEEETSVFQTDEAISLVFYFEDSLDITKMIVDQKIYSVERLSLKTYRITINPKEESGLHTIHIDRIITKNKVYTVNYDYKVWIESNHEIIPNENTTNNIQKLNKSSPNSPNIYRSEYC